MERYGPKCMSRIRMLPQRRGYRYEPPSSEEEFFETCEDQIKTRLCRENYRKCLLGSSQEEIKPNSDSSSIENSNQNFRYSNRFTEYARLVKSIQKMSENFAHLLKGADGITRSNFRRRSHSEPGRKTQFTFKDVEESLETFNGDNNQDITEWLSDFEEQACVLEWNDEQKMVYARRLLRGSAKLYVRHDLRPKTWRELKRGLRNEFAEEINTTKIHQKLAKSRKGNTETYSEFVYRMIRLAAPAKLRDKELIAYIVEAVGETLDGKLFLSEAQSLCDLKGRLKKYEDYIKKDSYKDSKKGHNRDSCHKCNPCRTEKQQDTSTNERRCFKCGQSGHVRQFCPDVSKKSINVMHKHGDEGDSDGSCVETEEDLDVSFKLSPEEEERWFKKLHFQHKNRMSN